MNPLVFTLTVKSDVRIVIYDMQGREVVSLIDRKMNPGYHSITWEASSHGSGIYFIKMAAGEYVST